MTTNISNRLTNAQNDLAMERIRNDVLLKKLDAKIHLEDENNQLKRDISALKLIIDYAPEDIKKLAKSIL